MEYVKIKPTKGQVGSVSPASQRIFGNSLVIWGILWIIRKQWSRVGFASDKGVNPWVIIKAKECTL